VCTSYFYLFIMSECVRIGIAELWVNTACGLRRAAQRKENSPEFQVMAQSNTRQNEVLAKLGQHLSTVSC
jgi:hypothetical protein